MGHLIALYCFDVTPKCKSNIPFFYLAESLKKKNIPQYFSIEFRSIRGNNFTKNEN